MSYLLALFGFAVNALFVWAYSGWHFERHSPQLLIASLAFTAVLVMAAEILARRPADFVGVSVFACLPWIAVPQVVHWALVSTAIMLGGPLGILAWYLGYIP